VLYVQPDQLSAAAGYLNREWGCYGYTIVGIESPTHVVTLFRVTHSDGSRFTIATDKWGNCRDWSDESGERDRVAAMHAQAVAA